MGFCNGKKIYRITDKVKIGLKVFSPVLMWSSYDRTWFSGPDKQEILFLILTCTNQNIVNTFIWIKPFLPQNHVASWETLVLNFCYRVRKILRVTTFVTLNFLHALLNKKLNKLLLFSSFAGSSPGPTMALTLTFTRDLNPITCSWTLTLLTFGTLRHWTQQETSCTTRAARNPILTSPWRWSSKEE
jgi:hypothetical protein